MTITQESVYDNLFSEKVDVSAYKNQPEEYEEFDGVFEGAYMVPMSYMNISNRTHQTRANGTDTGHVAQIAASIRNRGLNFLPYGEWDEKTKKFEILGGHHRIYAMEKNFMNDPDESEDSGENMGNYLYPIIAVSFSDDLKREEFKQSLNNHLECKGHTKADAVKFLQDLKDKGIFRDCDTDIELVKKIAYPLLSKHYPKIQTKSREEVVSTVFNDIKRQIKKWQNSETRLQIKNHFNASSTVSGTTEGDVCYISSEENAVGKAIYNAMRDRAVAIDKGLTSNPLRIKVITHFKSSTIDALEEKRKAFLRSIEVTNKCFDSKICQVEEVVLLEQILLPFERKENTAMKFNSKDGFKI